MTSSDRQRTNAAITAGVIGIFACLYLFFIDQVVAGIFVCVVSHAVSHFLAPKWIRDAYPFRLWRKR